MARHEYERDFDRNDERDEERWGRSGNEREDAMRPGGRRQGSGREYSDVRERGDWAREQEREGGQQSMEGRFGNMQDRDSGYGNRGWESSGLGGPSTYGSSHGPNFGTNFGAQGGSMYGGTGMGGGSFGAGMTGTGWNRPMGPHFGRGPKGYRRSDERIREDVNEALFHDHFVDATELEVQVHEAEVTLSGSVDHREAKRHAEACVWSVPGVRNVSSTIRVEGNQGQNQMQGQRSMTGLGSMGSMPGQRSTQGQESMQGHEAMPAQSGQSRGRQGQGGRKSGKR